MVSIEELARRIKEHEKAIKIMEGRRDSADDPRAVDHEVAERLGAIDRLTKKISKLKSESDAVRRARESYEGDAADSDDSDDEPDEPRPRRRRPGFFGRMRRGYDRVNTPFVRAQRRAGRKMRGAYDRVNDPFMRAQDRAVDAVKNTARNLDQHAHPWLLAIVAILIHIWDVLNEFSRGGDHLLLIITVYVLFALYAALFYYRTGWEKDSLQYFGISLLAIVLPLIFRLPILGEFFGRSDYLPVLLMVMPVWFLYIALHEKQDQSLHWTGKILIYIIIIALVIIGLGMFTLPDVFTSTERVQIGQAWNRVWNDIKDGFQTIKERMGAILDIDEWQVKFEKTFNPAMAYYTGEVEDNKEEPHGVYITRWESLYPTTYVGSDPKFLGRLEAKTFIPGGLSLTPGCRLTRAGKTGGWKGEVDTGNEPIEVNKLITRDILCTFESNESMTQGSYTAAMGIEFPFETWAYITNTFVSRQLLEQYLLQDRDINRELDIPRTTEAVFTNGPVMVGVLAPEQPIDVDPEARQPVKQRFGFTLDDRWTQGHFEEFIETQVLVPEPFLLEECEPVQPGTPASADGIRTYSFVRSPEYDPRLELRTITCQLVLPDKAAAERVIAFGDKTPVTFVVIAKYNYVIEKEQRIRIEE